MNGHVGGTARTQPSEGEIAYYHEVREREARGVLEQLDIHIGRAALPAIWARALKALLPQIGRAALGLVKALHADSPSGRRITRDELSDIAARLAHDVEAALLDEFGPEAA